MAGMQMPQMKNTQCITDDDLKKDPTTGLPDRKSTRLNSSH